MSKGKRVEPNIYRREGGSYAVSVANQGVTHHGSFKTLKEARNFRALKKRKKMQRDWSTTSYKKTGYITEDAADERKTIREVLKTAPRTTIERDGRKFTVVRLPDAVA